MPDPEHTSKTATHPFPPKLMIPASDSSGWIIKGVYSVVLYAGVGYLLLRRWDLLLIIFGIILFHEAGHFIAMKYYRYADVSVLFLPFIGALVKGSRQQVSQRQSAVIFLAGPLPGICAGVLVHFLSLHYGPVHIGDVPLAFIAQLLIWANIINLIPIYPLDGGQLLNRVFLHEERLPSYIFMMLSLGAIAGVAIISKFYILLLLPAIFIYRFFAGKKHDKIEKEIESSGIDIEKTYAELSDEDYWKIRSIIIRNNASLQNIDPGPPYGYDAREDRLAAEVENTLQRTLLLDVSLKGKCFIAAVWLFFLSVPWIFEIRFTLLQYFVR